MLTLSLLDVCQLILHHANIGLDLVLIDCVILISLVKDSPRLQNGLAILMTLL